MTAKRVSNLFSSNLYDNYFDYEKYVNFFRNGDEFLETEPAVKAEKMRVDQGKLWEHLFKSLAEVLNEREFQHWFFNTLVYPAAPNSSPTRGELSGSIVASMDTLKHPVFYRKNPSFKLLKWCMDVVTKAIRDTSLYSQIARWFVKGLYEYNKDYFKKILFEEGLNKGEYGDIKLYLLSVHGEEFLTKKEEWDYLLFQDDFNITAFAGEQHRSNKLQLDVLLYYPYITLNFIKKMIKSRKVYWRANSNMGALSTLFKTTMCNKKVQQKQDMVRELVRLFFVKPYTGPKPVKQHQKINLDNYYGFISEWTRGVSFFSHNGMRWRDFKFMSGEHELQNEVFDVLLKLEREKQENDYGESISVFETVSSFLFEAVYMDFQDGEFDLSPRIELYVKSCALSNKDWTYSEQVLSNKGDK